jgi:hypothetical protein
MTLVFIRSEDATRLEWLRVFASSHPLHVPEITALMRTLVGKRAHMKAMSNRSVEVPFGCLVTFSIETGHPVGMCRHMSMSSSVPSKAPSAEAAWMYAERLGFVGGLQSCDVWTEEQKRGKRKHTAVHLMQLLIPAVTNVA